MRLYSLEFGAGEVNDMDIDRKNDIRPLPHITFACHALAVPRNRASYSFIHSSQFIEHLIPTEQAEFIELCFDLLVSGGMFVAFTPDLDWIYQAHVSGEISEEHYYNLLHGKGDYAENIHLGLLNKERAEALLKHVRFDIHSIRSVNGSLEIIAFKPGAK